MKSTYSPSGTTHNPWLVQAEPRPNAGIRLFCVPFAGVGPSAFRGWAQSLDQDIETFYAHLPARESRFRDAPVTSVRQLADFLAQAIEPWLDRPFAVFGHSLGAVIGFETVRALRARGNPLPRALFVSASRAPHLPNPHAPLRHLGDDEFLKRLNERYEGSVPAAVMASPELRELFVPTLRADLTALETYAFEPGDPLECPISAFCGRSDPSVTDAAIAPWSIHGQSFRIRTVDGGHLYVQSARSVLVSAIHADFADSTFVGPCVRRSEHV
jgi:surfactin synthase thioesterase subunit